MKAKMLLCFQFFFLIINSLSSWELVFYFTFFVFVFLNRAKVIEEAPQVSEVLQVT